MNIVNCTKDDFDFIILNIREYWGSDRTLFLHHPILYYEFGNTAYVAKEMGSICGYLFGVYSQKEPYAYAQLIAVHNSFRNRGIAKSLYNHFIQRAKENNCTHIKAITKLNNQDSIKFHRALGFELIGKDISNGIHYCRNYSGPNEDRVVFLKKI
jgi:ribosomal protein S18 acetylase RimI-like enzyme